MPASPLLERAPAPSRLAAFFTVTETRLEDGKVFYRGHPRRSLETVHSELEPIFDQAGFTIEWRQEGQSTLLVATPRGSDTRSPPWTNIVLFLATIASTLLAGASWYFVSDPFSPDILEAVPFTLAVMGVLGIHELGHYAMSKYHNVEASLPYFIPVPSIIGTMGAVIKMKGQMPNRRALFDIGIAGPIAGLVATVVVTVIGLTLDPISIPESAQNSGIVIEFGLPPLMHAIAWAINEPLAYSGAKTVNPVVMGGWLGMFITFLNLIPVGQLDGGHIMRALLGDAQETLSALVPAVLFGLAGYLYYVRDLGFNAVSIWAFWGVFAMGLSYVGSATPRNDESVLDRPRIALAIVTFGIGALCFTPVPIQFGG